MHQSHAKSEKCNLTSWHKLPALTQCRLSTCSTHSKSQTQRPPDAMLELINQTITRWDAAAGSAPPQVDMAQRFVVIRCLRAQCESGQLLVDLFVNYDCDLEGQNLFERMVLALVRLAQGNVLQDATAQAVAEEQAMRLAVSQAEYLPQSQCTCCSLIFDCSCCIYSLKSHAICQ